VTVGPSSGGANFEATPTPSVSIPASIPNANELASVTAGRFSFFSSHSNVSQDIVVNVNTALGSATKGTWAPTGDYYITPDSVGAAGFSALAIPAGSATLDVNVTPNTDSSVEGPETVISRSGRQPGTQSTAKVVINDDTALPKVSIAATISTSVKNSRASLRCSL